jgi:hypothetical protein
MLKAQFDHEKDVEKLHIAIENKSGFYSFLFLRWR